MTPRLRNRSEPKSTRRVNNEPLYKVSDKVLCKFHGQLYDVFILEVKHVDIFEKERKDAINANKSEEGEDEEADIPTLRSASDEAKEEDIPDKFAYYIHYKQWNSNWDEWVRSDCLMTISEETRQQQKELKLTARKDKMQKKYIRKKRRRYRKKTTLSQSQNGDSDDTQATLDGMDIDDEDDGHCESSNVEELSSPKKNVQPQISKENGAGALGIKRPCLDTAAIDELLSEIRDHLSNIETIGFTLAAAFTKKLGNIFELYCVSSAALIGSVEQALAINGSMVQYTELSNFLDFLESGKWSRQGPWVNSSEILDQTEDLKIIFETCYEYFDSTKKFLRLKMSDQRMEIKA